MENINYLQVVRQTLEERFKMYMKCSKKELASMMAERDKYMSPDSCKEFECKTEPIVITCSSSASTEQ